MAYSWTTIAPFGDGLVVSQNDMNARLANNIGYVWEWNTGVNTTPRTIAALTTYTAVQTFSARPVFSVGLTVTANGLTVTAGGLAVNDGGVAVIGNSTITGDLWVSGTVTGVMGINGIWVTLTASSTITAGDRITVTGGGIGVTGNSTITGTLTVTGELQTASAASIGGDLNVDGVTVLQDALTGQGASFEDVVTVSGQYLELYGGSRATFKLGMYAQANTTGGAMEFRKARGTRAAPVGTNSGDVIVDFVAQGYTGVRWVDSSMMRMGTTGTVDDSGSGRMPGWVAFFTCPDVSGGSGPVQQLYIAPTGSLVLGNAALATNATGGFLYIPSGAGTPTGTPETFTGRVPLYYDSTNDKIYVYRGGWKATAALT